MSTEKTKVDLSLAENFIREHLGIQNPGLEKIEDGETAQAFFFEATDGPRVLRVSSRGEGGFLKDRFAQTHFGSEAIPIPNIIAIGEIQAGLSYSISERMPGKTLDKFNPDEIDTFMPNIIATLEAIHAVPPVGDGYGSIDLSGEAKFDSWKAKLKEDLQQDDEETTSAEFYDEGLAASLREEIGPRIDTMPEERKLVHFDFGFNNTLSDGSRITGVIDWEQAGYGDFLYDVAWLEFWAEKQGYADAFRQYYKEKGIDVPGFNERLVCYKLLIGLGALGFFARSRQPDKYSFAKQVVDRIEK